MKCRSALLAVLAPWALLLPCVAQAPKPDPQTILDQMTKFYRGLDSLAVTSELSVARIGEDGSPQLVETLNQDVVIERPGSLKIVSSGKGKFLSAASAYVSGGKAHVALPGQGIVAADGVPDIAAFYQDIRLGYSKDMNGNVFFDQNIALSFLNKLLFAELGNDWDKDLKHKVYVGEETFDPIVTHHLRLTTETQQVEETTSMDLDLWVLKGEQPLLVKIQPDMTGMVPQEDGAPPMKIAMVGLWKHWEIGKDYAASEFQAPKLDKDTPTFPSFEAMVQTQMAKDNPALQLTGTKVEDFEMPLLDGGNFKWSEHKGKHTVILDFWASWCGPCKESLPATLRVVKALNDDNVLLIAVNTGEPKSVARAFLEKTGHELTVAMDQEHVVAEQFGVRSIPQTVVIGKDGEIKQVHVGFSPTMEDEFLVEMKAILTEQKADNASKPH